MNDLEEAIYTKGLENLYGCILLGEEQALTCTEHLVYLTRALTASQETMQPIREEAAFVRCFCAACWPDLSMEIRHTEERSGHRVMRGSVSRDLCLTLLELESDGTMPDRLEFREKGRSIQCTFYCKDAVLAKKVFPHE